MLTSNIDGENSGFSAQDAGKADLNPNNHLKTTRNSNSASMYTNFSQYVCSDLYPLNKEKKGSSRLSPKQCSGHFANFTRRKFATPL